MNFLLNADIADNSTVLFVIIGVAVFAALYIGLAFLKNRIDKKSISELQAVIPEEDVTEEVAAITAAISLILEEEAKEEGREAPAFRVVSFKRTNNRRIGR